LPKEEKKVSNPFEGTTPPLISGLPSLPSANTPVAKPQPAQESAKDDDGIDLSQPPPLPYKPVTKERGFVEFDDIYKREAVYVRREYLAQLEVLYGVLPGNKTTILNEWLGKIIEDHADLLEQHKDAVRYFEKKRQQQEAFRKRQR
jgi:hypothetical protein